eukprot:scaffold1492_cov257-Pinguiococcus_pyrenoidosus.AAC.13
MNPPRDTIPSSWGTARKNLHERRDRDRLVSTASREAARRVPHVVSPIARVRIVEGQEAHVGREVAKGLPDGIHRARQAPILSAQHGQCPAVHGDVLGRHEEEEHKEVHGEHLDVRLRLLAVRRALSQPGVDLVLAPDHEEAAEQLDGHQPGFAASEGLDIHRVHQRRPKQLQRERPGHHAESALLRPRDPLLQQEGNTAAQAHRDALERIEQQQ